MRLFPALAVVGLLFAAPPVAVAGVDDSLSGRGSAVQGMFVVKVPIAVGGGTEDSARFGVDLRVQNYRDYELQQDDFDPRTGARVPNDSLEDVRTWDFDNLESVKPAQESNRPEEFVDPLQDDPS